MVKSVTKDASPATIFYGVTPFVTTDLIRLIIPIAFPMIALDLPSRMQAWHAKAEARAPPQ